MTPCTVRERERSTERQGHSMSEASENKPGDKLKERSDAAMQTKCVTATSIESISFTVELHQHRPQIAKNFYGQHGARSGTSIHAPKRTRAYASGRAGSHAPLSKVCTSLDSSTQAPSARGHTWQLHPAVPPAPKLQSAHGQTSGGGTL